MTLWCITGVSTGVTKVGGKDAGEAQKAVKYSSVLSFMLKPPSLITQGFEDINKTQEKLFKNMCNVGA